MDEVYYYGALEPAALYRVVVDADGVVGYSAHPSDPAWRLDSLVLDKIEASRRDSVSRLDRDEAIFLVHLWGGTHDALDDPASPREDIERAKQLAAGEPPTPAEMARSEAFRALRDVGGKKGAADPRPRVVVTAVDPQIQPIQLDPDDRDQRIDLLQDERPLQRSPQDWR